MKNKNTQTEMEDHTALGAEASQPGRLKRSGKLLLKLSLFFLALFAIFILGLSLMSSVSIDSLEDIQDGIKRIDSKVMFIRWMAIVILITYWNEINNWFAKRNSWSKDHLTRVLDGRWLMLGLLVFIEAIFVQRIHEYLFNI